MKTPALAKNILSSALAIAVAAVITLPIRSSAADTVKGATRQLQLVSPDSGKPIAAAEQIGMACSNCKDEAVTTSTWAGKGAFQKITVSTRHLCPDCKNTITSVGHGKAQTTQVSHACGKCKS